MQIKRYNTQWWIWIAFSEFKGIIIIPFHMIGKHVGLINGFNPFSFGKKK
jgi:hypothetical protein